LHHLLNVNKVQWYTSGDRHLHVFELCDLDL